MPFHLMPVLLQLCVTVLAQACLKVSSAEFLLLRKCHRGAKAVSNFSTGLVEQ